MKKKDQHVTVSIYLSISSYQNAPTCKRSTAEAVAAAELLEAPAPQVSETTRAAEFVASIEPQAPQKFEALSGNGEELTCPPLATSLSSL